MGIKKQHSFTKIIIISLALVLLNLTKTVVVFGEPVNVDSSGFVVLTDIVPEIEVELRYYTNYNFIGDRIRGYEEPVALVTKETAYALKKVNSELAPLGYTLKVYDAYRPQKAVDHFVEWARDLNDVRMKNYFYPEEKK